MKHSHVFAVMAVVFAIHSIEDHGGLTRALSGFAVLMMVICAMGERRGM